MKPYTTVSLHRRAEIALRSLSEEDQKQAHSKIKDLETSIVFLNKIKNDKYLCNISSVFVMVLSFDGKNWLVEDIVNKKMTENLA